MSGLVGGEDAAVGMWASKMSSASDRSDEEADALVLRPDWISGALYESMFVV